MHLKINLFAIAILFSVLILLLTESHTLPLKCCSILKGVLLTDKKHTYFEDHHLCLSFSYQLVPQTCPWALVLSLETVSKLSSSLLVILLNDFFYQLIYNNNILNLTLPTKFSTTPCFLATADCRIHPLSQKLGFDLQAHCPTCGALSERCATYQLLLSISSSIWVTLTLKLQCLLGHWLRCTFPLPWQTERWSNHNHSVC